MDDSIPFIYIRLTMTLVCPHTYLLWSKYTAIHPTQTQTVVYAFMHCYASWKSFFNKENPPKGIVTG